jgi:hypothetical protein
MSDDERKPELGGAVGRRATFACAMGEHDLCNSDPACQCRCHEGALAVLSTWTIFASPADAPGRFVVRRFDVVQGQADPVPQDDVTVHLTLESARNAVPDSADMCFQRSPDDPPSIVETWM